MSTRTTHREKMLRFVLQSIFLFRKIEIIFIFLLRFLHFDFLLKKIYWTKNLSSAFILWSDWNSPNGITTILLWCRWVCDWIIWNGCTQQWMITFHFRLNQTVIFFKCDYQWVVYRLLSREPTSRWKRRSRLF